MIFWSAASAFLGLVFALEGAGLFAHELNSALALLFLLLSAVLLPRGKRTGEGESEAGGDETDGKRTTRWGFLAGILLAAAGLLFLPAAWNLPFFGLALWFLGLDLATSAGGRRLSFLRVLALGTFFFAVYTWVSGTSVLLWYAKRACMAVISAGAGGPSLSLRSTFGGIDVAVLALCFFAAALLLDRKTFRSTLRLGVFFFLVPILLFIYLRVFAAVPAALSDSFGAGSWWKELLHRAVKLTYPVHLPLLLPLLLSPLVGWLLVGVDPVVSGPGKRRISPAFIIAALSAFLSVWALTNVPAPHSKAPRRVVFYKEGFLNWLKPQPGKYGRYSVGMFGNLPLLMEKMGWSAEIVPEITPAALAGKDILVLINLDDPVPREQIEAVKSFVREGGSLLVLGDHTFWKNERRIVLNDPIEDTHIRFRFDSADFFIGGWLHSYRFPPCGVTAGLGDHTNEPGSVVGASLEIAYPAAPLLIGRYGYLDPGRPDDPRRGFLGNLDYDPGETLGDVVLAAAENVGRGRVIVVGDTSSFTNGIQCRTWPFVERVFSFLGKEGRATIPLWREILGLALLGVFLLSFGTAVKRDSFAVAISGSGAVFLVSIALSNYVLFAVAKPPPLRGGVAVVDFSHGGRFSLEGWNPEGIDGVLLNLMREGFFTIATKTFDEDQISSADLFVTVVPTRPYTASEVGCLKKFMENGGAVILAVGWEERAGAESLLKAVGVEVVGRPLGPVEATGAPLPQPPHFFEAWPVRGGETLLRGRGEPVAVRKKIGKGSIVVIGDSQFLLNKNIETEEGGKIQNIRFLRWILEEVSKPHEKADGIKSG